MSDPTQKEAFLKSVTASNEFKKLLNNPSLTRKIQACSPDVNQLLDQIQRDYRSDAVDPAIAQLQEWAVMRAIGEIRDSLLLFSQAEQSFGTDDSSPDDEFDD